MGIAMCKQCGTKQELEKGEKFSCKKCASIALKKKELRKQAEAILAEKRSGHQKTVMGLLSEFGECFLTLTENERLEVFMYAFLEGIPNEKK